MEVYKIIDDMMTSIEPSEEAMEVDDDAYVEKEATGVDEARKISEADDETDSENHGQKQEQVLDPRIAKEFEEIRKNLPKSVLISDADIIEWTNDSLSETDNEIKALNEHALNTPLIDLISMKSVQQEINRSYRKKIIGGKYSRNYNGEVIKKLESELDICKIYEMNENALGLTEKKYLNAPFLINFEELYKETYGRGESVFLNGDVIDDDLYGNENPTSTAAETENNNIDQINDNLTDQMDEAMAMESNTKVVENLINEEVVVELSIIEAEEPKNADEPLVDVIEDDDDEEEEESDRPLIQISKSIFDADPDHTFSSDTTTTKNVPDLIPIPIPSSTNLSEATAQPLGRYKINETPANQMPASASQQYRFINTTTNPSSPHNKIFSLRTPTGIYNLRPHLITTAGALQGQLQKLTQQPRLSTGLSYLNISNNQTATTTTVKETNNANTNVVSNSNAAEEFMNSRTKILSPEFYRFLISYSGNGFVATHEYLCCHLCGLTFPSIYDHKYRTHLMVKHQLNMGTQDQAKLYKVMAGIWYKCRICSAVILSNLIVHESNHRVRERTTFAEGCFEKVITTDILHKRIKCGSCDSYFGSRRIFRAHLETNHPDVLKFILLEPDFRCGICFKKFDESSLLMKHIASCSISGNIPSSDTVLEMAKSVLNCRVCEKKHKTIEETQKCYSAAQLIRCLFCLQTTNSKNNFILHMRKFHGKNDQTISCPFCSQETSIKDSSRHCLSVHYFPALKEDYLKHTSPTGSPKFKQLKPNPSPAAAAANANEASESTRIPIMNPAGVQPKIIRIQASAFRTAPFNANTPPGQNFNRPIFVRGGLPKNYALFPLSSMPTTLSSNSPASQGQGGKFIPILTSSSGTSYKLITPTSSDALKQINKTIQANNSTLSASAVAVQGPISPNKISQNIEKEIDKSQQNTSTTTTTGPTTSKNATIASTSTESRQIEKVQEVEDEEEDDDELLVGL